MVERCIRCGVAWRLEDRVWQCRCGGLLDLQGAPAGSALQGWEWAEEPTPLMEVGEGLWLKMEQGLVTGSFKARGASAMIAAALRLGAGRVVADSSGNAGKAVAHYAGAAGIAADVYVPVGTDRHKIAAIEASGAHVVVVAGDRHAATVAAMQAVKMPVRGGRNRGATPSADQPWYASHVYQPVFHHGLKTLAYELAEQMASRGSPSRGAGRLSAGRLSAGRLATVVVPAGNGTLVLGLWLGFRELVRAGRLAAMPRLIAVQAEACAPLAGLAPAGPTAASGIAIAHPARATQVRAALTASTGRVVTVSEESLEPARTDLLGEGAAVEATSAVVWAALPQLRSEPDPVVLVLTGRG
jgi:threonine synthase